MADPRFFRSAPPLPLAEVCRLVGIALPEEAAGDQSIGGVAPVHLAGPEDITFLSDGKLIASLRESNAAACLILPALIARLPARPSEHARAPVRYGPLLLPCPEPQRSYATIARHFHPEPPITPAIAPTAVIHADAQIGAGCRIETGALIGAGAVIGAGCAIGAGSIIGEGVEIGPGSRIGAHVSITHALIGARVIVQPGARIGERGFGFTAGPKGLEPLPHLGRVVIGDDVDIGANTTIDRGTGDDTVIGRGTKIDNQVVIAHNCRIGANCVLAGQVGLSGSVTLGEGVMLGGQVGVADHITIGAGARLAAKSGVMSDIPAGVTYCGFPAQNIRDFHRQTVHLRRIAARPHGPERSE